MTKILKVLVVEDDQGIINETKEVIELMFDPTKVEFTFVSDLESALLLVKKGGWFAIILDGNISEGSISGSDGDQISRVALDADSEVRIIGFSASGYQNKQFWFQSQHFDAGKDVLKALLKVEEWLA